MRRYWVGEGLIAIATLIAAVVGCRPGEGILFNADSRLTCLERPNPSALQPQYLCLTPGPALLKWETGSCRGYVALIKPQPGCSPVLSCSAPPLALIDVPSEQVRLSRAINFDPRYECLPIQIQCVDFRINYRSPQPHGAYLLPNPNR